MKRGFNRLERIADMIQKSLAQMLLEEMHDDRFKLVTITGVTVARDLSHAKVYVSLLMDDEEKIKDTIAALNRGAKALRYHLAKSVEMRVIPELKFVYDASTAHGFHISGLIDAAVKKSENNK